MKTFEEEMYQLQEEKKNRRQWVKENKEIVARQIEDIMQEANYKMEDTNVVLKKVLPLIMEYIDACGIHTYPLENQIKSFLVHI